MTTSTDRDEVVSNNNSCDFYYSSIALIVGVPAIGDFLFGLDIGVTSYAISLWNTTNNASLTGLLVAAPSTGALLASFVVFQCSATKGTIGRRQELQLAGALYLVGAGLCLVSGLLSSLSLLLVARWIYGSGIAFGLHGATTFMGEMLPSSVRGSLMSLNEVSIVSGILCGYLVGYANTTTTTTTTTSSSWALLYVPAIVLASIMLWLSTMYLEESARWLALQGRAEEARKAWHFVWKPSSLQENDEPTWLTEASNNNNNNDASTTEEEGGYYKLLCHARHHVPALRAGWGLVAFLQLTGQPTVLAYAAPLLQQAGLSASSAVFVAVFKICMTFVALACVRGVGRKTLLYAGCTAMWMALVVLTATTTTTDGDNDDKTPPLVRLIAMLIYIGGYQIGFGTMVWLVSSEVFPAAIRGPAVAVAVQINFGLHALVEFLLPQVMGRTMFGVFCATTALAIVFLYYCVPETKGLTLEEIERQFALQSSSSRLLSSSNSTTTTDNGEHEPILASHHDA